MKRFLLCLCVMFTAVMCASAFAAPAKIQTIKVSNAREFLEALGSNRIIELVSSGDYNLSEWDPYFTKKPNALSLAEGVTWSEVFDGGELVLSEITNLTIKSGNPNSLPDIVVDPRYAYVMKFENCSDIVIEELRAGHSVGGECAGGVFGFEFANRVTITGSTMYGSGTQGLALSEVFDMKVSNSGINSCTCHIMTASGGENIAFENCSFFSNREFAMVNVSGTVNMSFENCHFSYNMGSPMFNVEDTTISVSRCTFDRNADSAIRGSDNVKLVDCRFIGVTYIDMEIISECREQLLEKYPSAEAIKKLFGDEAKWQEKTEPSPHDNNIDLNYMRLTYPGIEISTLEFTVEDEDRFYITSLKVEKAGFVDFKGIDIGSTRKDVLKAFGGSEDIGNNVLCYEDDESGYASVIFDFNGEKVVVMRFSQYID